MFIFVYDEVEQIPTLGFKHVLLLIGYAVLLFWLAVMVFAFFSHILGYSISETLISLESLVSFLGYSILLDYFHFPVKRGGKYWKLQFTNGLCMGILEIIVGVYAIILESPNLFAYLCFVIGASLILIHARCIYS